MPGRKMLCLGVTVLALAATPARSQHHSHSGGSSFRHHPGGAPGLGAVGAGWASYGFPYYVVGSPDGIFTFFPPLMMGPAAFFPGVGNMLPPPGLVRGPLLPAPPRGLVPPPQPQPPRVRPVKMQRSDPVRSAQLMTFGDRLFRAGNTKKAEERYHQASRAAPDQAAPHLRLAQIAMARGNFADSAARLREAETAQPGWILTAPDIQSIYGEPAEFSRQISRLEAYVQAHPDDRDAWLVLGAEWFLSGRTTKAADVFRRLDDPNRKPDPTLAAFLDASNQSADRPPKVPDQVK